MRNILIALAVCCVPCICQAQAKTTTEKDGDKKTVIKTATGETTIKVDADGEVKMETESEDGTEMKVKVDPPEWADNIDYKHDRAVYFPDYYTFYTPFRGYVYWTEDGWTASRELPAHLREVNLFEARKEVLEATEGEGFPEKDYAGYRDRFPAEDIGVQIIVPDVD